ncbi:MAG: entry exclusion 1 domain-containing protein [Alphaproteobacteria bacterium]|nr:entry exclusion 1 domain-containing protein [Alphaproteobacteria bacterium]
MAKVGAQRAAELTGRSKSTIQRGMNSGKISYELDPNGRRLIDVSELDRAFGLLSAQQQSGNGSAAPQASGANSVEQELEKASTLLETERLKMRIRMLEAQLESAEAQLEDLRGQRDQWQKQASQVLITSQYSQKQAEELAAELKERERRSRERREKAEQQKLEDRMKKMKAENQNKSAAAAESDDSQGAGAFGSLWKRVKGQN